MSDKKETATVSPADTPMRRIPANSGGPALIVLLVLGFFDLNEEEGAPPTPAPVESSAPDAPPATGQEAVSGVFSAFPARPERLS